MDTSEAFDMISPHADRAADMAQRGMDDFKSWVKKTIAHQTDPSYAEGLKIDWDDLIEDFR